VTGDVLVRYLGSIMGIVEHGNAVVGWSLCSWVLVLAGLLSKTAGRTGFLLLDDVMGTGIPVLRRCGLKVT
jgi:hypothetical protein